MRKTELYLWAATISKLALLITMGIVAFKTSIILGVVASVSFISYLGFVHLSDREIEKETLAAYNRAVSEYAKSLGGGTA